MNVHVKRTIPIEFNWVVKAYQKVRQGGKATGIDEESWLDFEKDVEEKLYLIWNRMSSGSYFPPSVREVEIPKKDGSKRKLGIPTVRDRIAQQVVKDYMEKRIDSLFHENSYGYRPLKSAKQALKQVQENCYRKDWVVDMDISKFFDEIDHEIMLKAVAHVMPEKWVKLYVQRWLEAPTQDTEGQIREKSGKGTPQGGVISPLLANLYLHFTLDAWLEKYHPECSFVRYADDVVIHCGTRQEAEMVLEGIKERLQEVKLSIKESKTKIAYCKDYRRRQSYENVQFEFLGFSFKPMKMRSKFGMRSMTGFGSEISKSNQSRIMEIIRNEQLFKRTEVEIKSIALNLNSKLRGWINYYETNGKRKLRLVLMRIDSRLIRWLKKKYRIGGRKAYQKLKQIKQENPRLFYHWEKGYSSLY
jgi:RNA-directed DNA polymerase